MAENSTSQNILDYVESQFETFAEQPLTEVDSLVFSWLCYWDLSSEASAARTMAGMPLLEAYRRGCFEKMTAVMLDTPQSRHMLAAVVASPRFGDARIAGFVKETSGEDAKQFSAMTFLLSDGSSYVAFRGTDGTVVGWKEDFNMAFEGEVPSQRDAVDYLNRVAARTEGPLWVGGHSKGGNLAVYALVNAGEAAASRLKGAFSHDGPGFTEENLSSRAWQAASHLIKKTIPKDSVIGMLFERQEDYAVVASTGTGFMQHDPFTWVVEGTQFRLEEGLSAGARHLDAGINAWVAGMTREERAEFIDTLFAIIEASGESVFVNLGANWQTSVPAMYAYLRKLEPERREPLLVALRALLRAAIGEVALPAPRSQHSSS